MGKEICCDGNIFPKSELIVENCCGSHPYDSAQRKCCAGNTVYDPDSHFCCGGEVYPHDNGLSACCENGEQLINTTRQTCCSDRTVEGVGECCGNDAVYDSTTEHCCLGPAKTGYVQHVGREAVIGGKLTCCNSETIDMRNTLCCQDNAVHRQTPFTQCCGPKTFDSLTQVCCERTEEYKISPLLYGRNDCCGLEPYNKDNDVCCSMNVKFDIGDGLCCGSEPYNPLRSSCCGHHMSFLLSPNPKIPGVQGCCNGQSFLKTTQICCSGVLLEQESGKECCGTGLYDPSISLCCGGQIVTKLSPTSKCCGNSTTAYDTVRQTCCGNGPVEDIANGSCCRVGNKRLKAFDPLLKQCCKIHIGKIQDINAKCCGRHALSENQLCNSCRARPVLKENPEDNKVCCLGNKSRTYNNKTQRCHRNKFQDIRVYDKKVPREGEGLCKGETYPQDTKMCCGGRIQDREYFTDKAYSMKCCGNEAYVPEWDTCVNKRQKVKGIPHRFAGMCRGTVFNNASLFCDANTGHIRPIVERDQGLEVCDKAEGGYYAYDPNEKECCGGVLIGWGETCCNGRRFETPGTRHETENKGRCCGQVGFNPKTHVCCDGVLYPITAGQECCGRYSFNPHESSNKMCCNDRLLSTENGRTECTNGVAHRPTDTVCNGQVYEVENGECCGATLMDSNVHICCQGQFLYEKAEHGNTCCGKVAYNSNNGKNKCCGNSLFPQAENLVCCGNSVMDPYEEVCHAINNVSYIFSRDTTVVFCSEEMYDPKRQTCCDGILYNFVGKCCGSEVISPWEDAAVCCGGTKQRHDFGINALCCGGEVWDARRYNCCGGRHALPIYSHWRTCCNGVVKSRARCRPRPPGNLGSSMCGGEVYNASLMGCCGKRLYDPKKHFCSADTLQPLCRGVSNENDGSVICCAGEMHNASTTGCCNNRTYQLAKQTCCGTHLKNVKNGACCGPDTPYNQERYICCAGDRLRRKKNGRTECCGTHAINPNTDTCCEDTVTRGIQNGTCCGNRAFNPADKVCCPKTGKMYRRRTGLEDSLQSCCPVGSEYDIQAGTCIQPECDICTQEPRHLNKNWKKYIHLPTILRGTATNTTTNPNESHKLLLTRVTHLNHNKRQSSLDSRELEVIIPPQCPCHGRLQPGKAYIVMSRAHVESSTEGTLAAHLVLKATDYLTRAANKMGSKIKYRLCKRKKT